MAHTAKNIQSLAAQGSEFKHQHHQKNPNNNKEEFIESVNYLSGGGM
jgi:hypothetical protein